MTYLFLKREVSLKMKNSREHRSASIVDNNQNYVVEGYAALFDPYVIYESEGRKIYEKFEKSAFENADMSDVIFQYDHRGKVFARVSNKTLVLETDDIGLKFIADLGSSEASKEMYQEIKAGLVTKMSWAFKVDSDYFDSKTDTRVITKISKIYDVSCVSIPANDKTYINARSYFNGVIEIERQELLERERLKLEIELIESIERSNI